MNIKENAPKGATHYHKSAFYRYNSQLRQYEIYMHGIGWVGVMLGYSTKLKPL